MDHLCSPPSRDALQPVRLLTFEQELRSPRRATQEEDLIPIEVSTVLNRKSAAEAQEATRVLAVWSRP